MSDGAPSSAGGRDAGAETLQLEQLPAEILTMIVELLVPQQPEVGETLPVPYDKLVPGEPWFDFTRSRRGLASLCLTNRRFLALAQPLLYRVLAILDEEGMILLVRTLVDRQDYGSWIRCLSSHLTLTSEKVIRETRRVFLRLQPTLRIPRSPPRTVHNLCVMLSSIGSINGGTAREWGRTPQLLLTLALLLSPQLNTLLLQIPVSYREDEYDFMFAEIEAVIIHPVGPLPFQHLETLLLQGDPDLVEYYGSLEDDSIDLPDHWGARASCYRQLWFAFPNLKTLEVSCDDGIWENMLDFEDDQFVSGGRFRHPFLGGLRHIYLHNSCAGPTDLYRILRNAPELETLYMTPSDEASIDPPLVEDAANADEEALDTALELYAHNLHHLDVSWYERFGTESEIGQHGRLNSLPRLQKLEKLCVQLAVLYGTKPATVLDTPLAEQLPPNLVELTLEDWWWSNVDTYEHLEWWEARDAVAHYQSQGEYRRTALRMLEQFARDAPERLPRLRKVLLLCKIPWTWMMDPDVPLDFHFREVRDVLASKGIQFLVEDSSDLIEDLDADGGAGKHSISKVNKETIRGWFASTSGNRSGGW